jgi:hypothetical protein
MIPILAVTVVIFGLLTIWNAWETSRLSRAVLACAKSQLLLVRAWKSVDVTEPADLPKVGKMGFLS